MTEHTSQGLSQRLHDKGFRGEHECDWIFYDGHWSLDYSGVSLYDGCESFPAYTFSELWAVVPIKIKDSLGKWQYLEMRKHVPKPSFSSIAYANHALTVCEVYFNHESPAEAMGLLVEWLIDNGYVEVSQ